MATVLWVSHFLPFPPKGGSSQRSFHLLRELSAAHRIHYVGIHKPSRVSDALLAEARAELGPRLASFVSIPSRSMEGLPRAVAGLRAGLRGLPLSSGMLMHPDFWSAVQARIHECEIVHCDTFELAVLLRARVPRAHPRLVAHFHNVESEIAERSSAVTRPPWRWIWAAEARGLRALERRSVRLADLCIAVSERDARHLEDLGAARAEVVDNGVDVDYLRPSGRGPGSGSDRPTVVWIGGLQRFANADGIRHFLSAIWPRVAAEAPDSRLVLVGRPPHRRPPIPVAADRVEFTGFVDDARPFFHAASAFIVPLRVGGGTRLKILDALACGAPVVSTRIGAEGLEVVDDRDLLIADEPDAFADAVLRLLREAGTRQRLARSGRTLMEARYDWRLLGARLSQAYGALAEGGTSDAPRAAATRARW